ncbi:MAG TPA: glycoside hydrolase family 2 TIM barrel-domain containing protein [Bacteroidales bacterium]|nr:glycoside hydrolase family 2 TIM barrel-domain containing protein [Bacteroidales bacterium]
MKRLFFLIPAVFILSTAFGQNIPYLSDIYKYIENPAILDINQEEGHTIVIPYNSAADAMSGDKSRSPGYLSLNGRWKFHFFDIPEKVPLNFFDPKFDDSAWDTIHVPSNWEMQGYGDPLFRNIATPFHADPPHVPREYNPTGAYRRFFSVPPGWKGKQVFLRMEKTASACFLYVNGKGAGYNEGAQEPAEYNITPFLKDGKNSVAVVVFKYSDGVYLEDQDYWRLAGIFDDVWLCARNPTHLFDWTAVTEPDREYKNFRLDLAAMVKNFSAAGTGGWLLRITLLDKMMKPVRTFSSEKFTVTPAVTTTIKLSGEIESPSRWSAEDPCLYTLVFELVNSSGKAVETASGRIGFKKTEIRHQVFYLNGKPVKLNGINSHMQHPLTGHAMDEATIRKDLTLLKRFNINCVRTSHYPPVNKYLELADEFGIYIVDETGDEAHATDYLSSDKAWEGMYRERARRMVLRDRNHPCILFWSAGNESGEGDNICAVIDEGRKYDKTRYWMYGGNAFSHKCEEIIGPRYPRIFELLTRVFQVPDSIDPRPSFLDEYLAVTGNGGGGLDDYWELFRKYPRSMGGAIWDFVSTGLTEKIRTLKDESSHNVQANIMGRAKLVEGRSGRAIDLNGHDQWVEVYRDKALDISGDKLTLSLWVKPRRLSNSSGSLITKGSWQFGLYQENDDSVKFYFTTTKKFTVAMNLPVQWYDNWHHLVAIYDGTGAYMILDGRESYRIPASGNILNTPYPLNIGRDAEKHGQETSCYLCDATIDQAAVFSCVVGPADLDNPSEALKRKAAVWLDFEKESSDGEFFSYGIGARTYGAIWPDRKPEPEMWQIRKTGQPVSVKMIDPEKGRLEIENRYLFTDLGRLACSWCLKADSQVLERGTFEADVPPLGKKIITLPYPHNWQDQSKEHRLVLSFALKERTPWAEKGFEIAWDEFDLSGRVAPAVMNNVKVGPEMKEDADSVVVRGNGFSYTFGKHDGMLNSIRVDGEELLRRGPVLNMWRAPLANETDEWNYGWSGVAHRSDGFGNVAATEWYTTGLNAVSTVPAGFDVTTKNDGRVVITTGNVMMLGFGWGACINSYTYIIDGSGELTIEHRMTPDGILPGWVPRIGLEWVFDKRIEKVVWYGRGPQENYPDRKSGYRTDIYSSTVSNMFEPYVKPEDCGLRTDNRWVKLLTKDGRGLEFTGSSLFNFNAYPYTTENLSRASYTYQLHPSDGVTFNLDYKTSGVGCTALSVFPKYRVTPEETQFTVTVRLVR